MKRIASYLIAMALVAFTFTSCEDVPSPFGEITKPSGEEKVVIDPAGSGTEADPYNVAAVVELCSGLASGSQTDKDVYVKGIVTEIKDIDTSGTYGNATYWISDDADGKANKFYIYRGFGLGGKKFNEGATPVKAGDKIVIKSPVMNYNGTYETVQNKCIIVELNGVKDSGSGNSDTPSGTDIGSKDAPITCAKALELIKALADGGESDGNAFVKGKVIKVTTNQENFEKYGNLNYLISDDGSEANAITVYSGDGLNGEKFKGITDLAAGDEVIVYGKLYKYVNKSGQMTPEINKGNYLVSLVKGSGGGNDTPSSDLGTKDAPLTVAKALEVVKALADNGETEEAYVKGTISQVASFNSKYKSITYYISDDGAKANELQIYSGKNIGGAEFNSKDELAEGDVVVVKGKLKKYVNDKGTTLEMNQPNEIISIIKGSGGGGGGGASGATTLDVNFKTNGQGDWTIANVKALPSGLDFVWTYDSRYGMKATAYVNSKRYETDNWLVSPTLNLASGATMTFKQALNFATSDYVKIMYTTTNGTGDVKSSEWKEATVDKWPAGSDWKFIESKATLPAGTVRVAFRYTSTADKAATWEIESLSIK